MPVSSNGPRLSRETWIGLAILVSIVVLLVVGFIRPRVIGSQEATVRVTFRDTSSLARFDRDVRVAGANVGTVGVVERDGDNAIVELNFPTGSIGPVHADATAELRPHLLFDGSAYVAFSPGSKDAPLLGDRVLGLSQTRDFVSLERAFRVLDPDTRSALQGGLGDLARSLGTQQVQALHDAFAAQPRLFGSLRPAMRAAQGPGRRELAGTIRGYSQTVAGLAHERDSLGPALEGADRTLRAIRTDGDRQLESTLRALPASLTSAASGGQALGAIVEHLEPLARDLQPAARELTPTLRAVRPLLRDSRGVLDATPAFVRTLRGTLRSAADAAPDTRRVLELLDPSLDVLRNELLPFMRSDSEAGIPIYQQLSGFGVSAGGSMSPVRSLEDAEAQRTGAGHAWHLFARSGLGVTGTPGCSTLAEPIRGPLAELELCIP